MTRVAALAVKSQVRVVAGEEVGAEVVAFGGGGEGGFVAVFAAAVAGDFAVGDEDQRVERGAGVDDGRAGFVLALFEGFGEGA